MSSLITAEIKSKADELYHGHEICQQKSNELLSETCFPNGLLPLKDIEECGIMRETGFMWLKQKKSCTHKFEKIEAKSNALGALKKKKNPLSRHLLSFSALFNGDRIFLIEGKNPGKQKRPCAPVALAFRKVLHRFQW
ncbi:hypothetical protein EV1_013028 [Malus domestica]